MITKKIVIREPNGLHARPAMILAQKCQQFSSKVNFCNGCEKADGCSILELLLLGAGNGAEVEVSVQGADEALAVKEITEFFEQGSGI